MLKVKPPRVDDWSRSSFGSSDLARMEQTNEEKKNEGPKIETKVENGPPQLDAQEKKRLQAMLGAPKSQEAVYIGNEKNEKKALNSHPPQATIYFINCHDSEYHVDSLSTKILIGLEVHELQILLQRQDCYQSFGRLQVSKPGHWDQHVHWNVAARRIPELECRI
eukprot:TRINITY_DN751_c0_g3_i1.p1 TRINITY_DN751_c0_g3~~TRINITY_DN751_c0_g3_i1.p1  ORF type:complete len:165 (+),score=19.44 TRINITY_DN751_c0_g3_i1:40-534(+)